MLKRVSPVSEDGAMVRIADAKAPAPFVSGLEYGAPARGVWNIVHVGMLIPGAHEIYVCAGNCLRGVVLTAVEMGAQRRFSTITIKENNVLDGDMERLLIDGVTDNFNPPAVASARGAGLYELHPPFSRLRPCPVLPRTTKQIPGRRFYRLLHEPHPAKKRADAGSSDAKAAVLSFKAARAGRRRQHPRKLL